MTITVTHTCDNCGKNEGRPDTDLPTDWRIYWLYQSLIRKPDLAPYDAFLVCDACRSKDGERGVFRLLFKRRGK